MALSVFDNCSATSAERFWLADPYKRFILSWYCLTCSKIDPPQVRSPVPSADGKDGLAIWGVELDMFTRMALVLEHRGQGIH